ncbi:glycosyltransferase [Acinetobacter entericus]|uniref:Glycosyltransferase n=1 Tax=Acinetobacter entericus TaxID=2989714 RepID=A0ABT3NHU4_9GAMM|nr:glycosyltransferase [Acinetobacter entericus]MCW8039115.1 glycosyltransferase [Acinetobacter entericus]
MSNICIISANSLENENASRNRVLSFVNSFLAEGHTVNLISMDHAEYQLIQHDHFTHHKIPFIDTKIPSFIKRAFLEMKIASSALNKANELNCDVNLITIPSMFLLHLSGLLTGSSTKILDIRDLSWEYLDENSLVNRVAKRIFTYSALLNFKRFNILSVTNDHEFEYVSKHIQSTQKIVKVPNGVAQKVFNELCTITENATNVLTVTYVGNVGLAQDLSTLIAVSKQLPQVVFNIVGGGTDFERVSAFADPKQTNLKFLGRKKFDELIEIYNHSDILYAQLTPDFASAMPSKLYEYLSTGKYVIYGGVGVASNTLNKFEHVSLVQPCDIAVLKTEIEKVIASQSYKGISVQNRMLIASQYIRDITVQKLVSEI